MVCKHFLLEGIKEVEGGWNEINVTFNYFRGLKTVWDFSGAEEGNLRPASNSYAARQTPIKQKYMYTFARVVSTAHEKKNLNSQLLFGPRW